jgi:hypothetical protein
MSFVIRRTIDIRYNIYDIRYDIYDIYLTTVGLTPGGSSTVHILHTNSTQNTEKGTYITIKN